MEAKIEIEGLDMIAERLETIEKQLRIVIENKPAAEVRYYSRANIAKILGVSPSTVWRWEADGVFPSYEISGRKRYRLNEIVAAVESNKAANIE